jgi:uncharacterized membrane protein (DUF2068 family)
MKRPGGITALSLFFASGAIISCTATLALLMPTTFLHHMWKLNPRAETEFATMGSWALLLLTAVCLACAFASIGLWRMKLWGYWIAIGMLVINLIGDVYNTVSGTEPRAVIGIPIVLLILVFFIPHKVRDRFTL